MYGLQTLSLLTDLVLPSCVFILGGRDKIAGKIDSSSETLFQLSCTGNPILITNYYIELFMLKANKFKNISYGMHVTKDKGIERINS